MLTAMVSLGTRAQEVIFSFTADTTTIKAGTYTCLGGTAQCTKDMASGGSNELTIGDQTFYKFNSSSSYKFTLASGTFQEGDVFTVTAACNATSDKNGKGVTLNGIAVTADFPKNQTNTLVYTVTADDAIAGKATVELKRNDSDIKFGTITVTRAGETCTKPETALVLDADKKTDVYEGDVVTFTTTGGNGNPVKIYDGKTEISSPWTATAGSHSFTAEQEQNDTICGSVTEAIVIEVASKSPVTSVKVTGPTHGFIGQEITLTCEAENATQYQWVDGYGVQIEGATEATYKFTPTEAGTYKFVCTAKNAYNSDWVMSDNTITIEVTKLCGELIRATTQQEVTGVAGGSVDTNLGKGDSKKLDKSRYFGVKLSSGTFQAGDMFTIHITAAADLGKFMLYADKEGTEQVYDQGIVYTKADAAEPVICPTGDMTVVLPAAASGKQALYLYRENGNTQWNVSFDTIYVTRPCEASSDNTIAQLTVNDVAVTATDNVYSYQVPASSDLTAVVVKYTLNHPFATATPESGFSMNVPAAGTAATEQEITVKAENGAEAKYKVSISKAASLSADATLKELAVKGYTLTPAFADTVYYYEITKAYGAEDPAAADVTATPNNAAAKAEVNMEYGEFVVKVTAEDGETVKTYRITILTADAPKDLLEVVFSNGAKGAINTESGVIEVPYLNGTAEPSYVSAAFASWVDSAKVEAVAGGLKVTGKDGKDKDYIFVYRQLTPAAVAMDTVVVFDTVPEYIFAPYGFDTNKGVKFAQSKEEKSNRRMSSGNSRIYIALPAAGSVVLTSGTQKRAVKIYVNGTESSVTETASSGSTFEIALDKDNANFVAIESNQQNGDGGITKMQLKAYVEPQTKYYKVTLVAEHGKIEVSGATDLNQVAENTELTFTATPDEGYEFKGWEGQNEASNMLKLTITADITIKAVFEERETPPVEPEYFTVTFMGLNERVLSTQQVKQGDDAVAPTDVDEEGYEFKGWDKEFTNVQSDLTVNAIYEQITGLDDIRALDKTAPMYNVSGMRVDADYKGVVIQGGRKFISK